MWKAPISKFPEILQCETRIYHFTNAQVMFAGGGYDFNNVMKFGLSLFNSSGFYLNVYFIATFSGLRMEIIEYEYKGLSMVYCPDGITKEFKTTFTHVDWTRIEVESIKYAMSSIKKDVFSFFLIHLKNKNSILVRPRSEGINILEINLDTQSECNEILGYYIKDLNIAESSIVVVK